MANRSLWMGGGTAGVVGVVCYIFVVAFPWPETRLATSAALVIASAWPILSIIYSYSLYTFVAAEHESSANRLALLFAVAAFTTLLAMLVVQLAVGAGFAEITKGLDEQTAKALGRGLRIIDLGLDVAWDMLISAALIFSGVAMRRRSGLGLAWSVPSVVLGTALAALNAVAFPSPPRDRGLIDIGPVIGIFVMALGARLAILGRRATG
jgi:hypothetical protein